MRRFAIALAIALAAPSWAQARVHTIAPPGNSGVGQYVETLPTAGGGQPTSTVHSGGAGGPVGRGGSGGGPGASAGGAVASSTLRALARQGSVGAATAALAQATAPRPARSGRSAAGSGHGRVHPSGLAASGGDGSSPSTSVIKALTGSTSSGGLGPLLPIALIGSVLAAAVLTLVRRRGTS